MDNGLIVFLGSSTEVLQDDLDFIMDYRLAKVVCVVYNYTTDMLDELESRLEEQNRKVQFIDTDGRCDPDLESRIKTAVAANEDTTFIDITFASPYHAASVMNLGGSEKVEVWYSAYGRDGKVVRTRMDRVKHIYNGLSDTCYMLLDIMSKEPMHAEIDKINTKFKEKGVQKRGKTAVYDAFYQMAAWDLIQRCEGVPPEEYKSRNLNFYRLTDDQMWDYYSYRRLQKKRMAELEELKKKQKDARRSNEDAKKVAGQRRRKNARRK